ncbi:MAG TPA: N-acetyltransferase [Steroidobacteraceae bacterium]|nr:N-acetyltransferase [Steroidobacteraceae bacterium]
MFTIHHEVPFDVEGREALLDAVMGEARFTKTAARLRENRLPADGLSFIARARRRVIGTVQLWNISAGPGRPALLLGPLAVASDRRNRGVGTALVRHALDEARRHGHGIVLLVGDAPYYGRFGFSSEKTPALWLPGPYERHRLLAHELAAGALDGARGLVHPTGRFAPKPDLPALVARLLAGRAPVSDLRRKENLLAPRAA